MLVLAGAVVMSRVSEVTCCIVVSSSALFSELEAGTRSGQLPVLSVSVDVSAGMVVLTASAAGMLGFRESEAIAAVALWIVGGG